MASWPPTRPRLLSCHHLPPDQTPLQSTGLSLGHLLVARDASNEMNSSDEEVPVVGGDSAAEPAANPGETHALDRPGRTQHYDGLLALRVLFVDDDLATREAVREVLQLAGARVEVAASVVEGLAAVAAFEPEVIMCDIAMPGEDGYAFIRKLRARESDGVHTPVLAFSALASEADRRRALSAGFQMYAAKPIDIDRLRDALLALANMRSASGGVQAPSAAGA